MYPKEIKIFDVTVNITIFISFSSIVSLLIQKNTTPCGTLTVL